jgi:2Fe-2S ferredoxin
MAKIVIKNLSHLTINYKRPKSLLNILQENFVDWMHACGGKGRCTTCTANIISGFNHLEPRTDAEEIYFRKAKLGEKQRLACQTICTGDVEITVPNSYKLPHLSYTE